MPTIRARLRNVLSRDLFIDLDDTVRAGSLKAHEIVRDHARLKKKRNARGAEGQLRFRILEEDFEETCALHGGRLLDGGVMPNTDLKIHQPFMRFEQDGQGVILALATMPATGELPAKNKSRLAGVTINYDLSLRLNLDGTGPKVGDIFAVLLVARNRERAGKIEEIALGVIESNYESYLYYEALDGVLADAADVERADPRLSPAETEAPAPQVTLKKVVKRFVPPEAPPSSEDEEGGAEGL
ncbi:hypothetical protein IVB16_15365 [Bradyrhizobium sp. 183]|uniref:hypothetical protein n=1 Tax=unclassified Bradyrhizobium TaxID=2631580 RepID=UPI001FFEA940|nr:MULTISPECIES: hypothetical protein [unclassified Bradyrhizobium]UPJ83220.1 hypothetical protein IVB17_15365 [Bradyrhizobium sp. 184]UPJ91012.1 hypothetical protein IVB16_15365 [Bradyrhizobium sp. 183]